MRSKVGGCKYVERHHAAALTKRERIELPRRTPTPFLELSPLAA